MRTFCAILCITSLLQACSFFPSNDVGATQYIEPQPSATATTQAVENQIVNEPTPSYETITSLNVSALQPETTYTLSGAIDFAYLPQSGAILYLTEQALAMVGIQARAIEEQISVPGVRFFASAVGADVVAWSLDTREMYTLDARTGHQAKLLERASADIASLAISPLGERLAYSTVDARVVVWNLLEARKILEQTLPFWVTDVSLAPQGDMLAYVNPSDFSLYFAHLQTGEEPRRVQWTNTASPQLNEAVLSPDWMKIAWVARATVAVMQVETEQVLATLVHQDYITSLAWSPDSALLATASAGEVSGDFVPLVTIWNASGGQMLSQLTFRAPVLKVQFSADGRTLMVLSADGELRVFGLP